jgi:hypothetical protein
MDLSVNEPDLLVGIVGSGGWVGTGTDVNSSGAVDDADNYCMKVMGSFSPPNKPIFRESIGAPLAAPNKRTKATKNPSMNNRPRAQIQGYRAEYDTIVS